MLLPDDRQALLDLCNKFICSGEDVTLAHLLDYVDEKIPDRDSQIWKEWNRYMECLNETWVRVHKEGEELPWPEAPGAGMHATQPTVVRSNVTPHTTNPTTSRVLQVGGEGDAAKVEREKLRAERKLQLDGAQGVGPARHSKSFEEVRKGGKPRDLLVDDLVLEFEGAKKGSGPGKLKSVVYCIGCDKETVGRDPNRIKAHAKNCTDLIKSFPTLHVKVVNALAERAHSTRIEKEENSNIQPEESGASASTKPGTLLTFMNPAKISESQKRRVELLMFRMFICCALPWALMDSPFFTELIQALAPNFKVPDRSAFFPKHLAQETAVWCQKFKEFLTGQSHLTFSFDGWSTRARDEVYTFHTTTPRRRSFFTDGQIFKGVSVTSDALLDISIKLLNQYDHTRYSAVVGDGGSNVRSAKTKIQKHFPWMINIYDPCHNLNLYLKDLGKLYKDTLTTVSAIANYFGKSNYGTFHLDMQRKAEGVREGIKSHSDTRFSSSYQQVVSVHACMGAIKKCIQKKTLKFDTAATKKLLPYIEDGMQHWQFMASLTGFIQLLSSGANAILTLEGENTTCADVFYAWVCMSYHLEQILASPTTGLANIRSEVIRIYNHRFEQMMNESSYNIFLLAYYLHPLFCRNGGLQLAMPALQDGEVLQPSQYPALFKVLLTAVLSIFQGEQRRLQDSGREVVPKLIKEFIAYAYNHEPFNRTYTRRMKPLKWWKGVLADSNARLIGQVAVKIFSISPSEICDERTASRLGWFNAARRSSMTPEHLVDSVKLYDYYTNGFDEGKSTHTARVHLSKVESSTSTAPSTLSAPSLMDLINIGQPGDSEADVAAMEEIWFNHPDPYDLAETERVDEALQPPTVVRSSTRFDMANYVQLTDSKLIALIANANTDGPGAALEKEIGVEKMVIEGVPGEWSVESFLGA